MRTVLIGLAMASLALAASYTAVSPSEPRVLTPGYMTDMELSRDNGNITNAFCYINGTGSYVGDQYAVPTKSIWYLTGIKYYCWTGWPDSIFQGFGVACWKMESSTPGAIVWPASGTPVYNPNTGGNWITQEVYPALNLSTSCPAGFLVGIDFMYSYPAMDAFGVDNTGPGLYDWANPNGSGWATSPYGKGTARAFVIPSMRVDTSTIGQIRALYR